MASTRTTQVATTTATTATTAPTQPSATPTPATVTIHQPPPALPTHQPAVRWSSSVVDNEHLNKKKSKKCCIYHKPRAFGAWSDTDSDCDCPHD